MLADIAATPAQTIDDVIAKMTAIDARLADADGLKWFNRLYLQNLVDRYQGDLEAVAKHAGVALNSVHRLLRKAGLKVPGG